MNKPFFFQALSESELQQLVNKRDGETKLGEILTTDASHDNTEFVIVGIEESIGPLANLGNAGAEHAFSSFLKRFVNMQSNQFVDGKKIAIVGSIKGTQAFQNVEDAQTMVEMLDSTVYSQLLPLFKAGKKVIVIGGGHNNAYPLIKALKEASEESVSVINLDPHSDCRPLEGRHSGNSFSYALEEHLLDQYNVIGLHRPYNSQYLLDYLNKKNCYFSFFEDYVSKKSSLSDDLLKVITDNSTFANVGIELDMDAIAGMPSSAFTPSGFSPEEARFYISKMAQIDNCSYLHLPEAAPKTENEQQIAGKMLAYLVWDFIFHYQSKERK